MIYKVTLQIPQKLDPWIKDLFQLHFVSRLWYVEIVFCLVQEKQYLIKYFVEKWEKENIWIFLRMRVSTLTGTDILGVDHR